MAEPKRQHICQVHHGIRAEQRLAQLGLTATILLAAAGRGDDGRQQCTAFHPRQSAGHRMWSDTTAALRERCLGLVAGWTIDRTNNYETVAHRERGISIAVVGGDEFTGWRGPKDPRARRKRGPMTTKRVEDNFLGMAPLFPLPTGGSAEHEQAPEKWQTWFFLIRATEEMLYLELSQPIGLNGAGFVADWHERILLPPLPVVGGVTPIPDDDDDDDDSVTISKI